MRIFGHKYSKPKMRISGQMDWNRLIITFLILEIRLTCCMSHPKVPGLQAIIRAAELKDCWICTHGDAHSEEKIALVGGPIPLTWWRQKPKIGWGPTWVSHTDLAWRPNRRENNHQVSRYEREWERNWYSKGVPEYEIESFIGQHPICIQNDKGTGRLLGEIPIAHCAHTWLFDMSTGEFTPLADDHGPKQEECDGNGPGEGNYPLLHGGSMRHTFITLFNFTEGAWFEESESLWGHTLYVHDRMGILINKTKENHMTCDGGTYTWESPFWQIWRSIACAYHRDPRITHAWYGGGANKSGDFHLDIECKTALNTGEKKIRAQRWGSGNFLTMFLNEPGMYWLCGKAAYKALPPGWSGRCAPAYLAPKVELRQTLNASETLNLGSFLHRVHRDASNPLVVRNTWFHQTWRVLLPGLGVYELEQAVKNISKEMEQTFDDTLGNLMELQEEVDSLSKVVVQNRKALDSLAAQQGGACSLIGEKCCYYVNNQGKIDQ
ncbi:endogenous retroviral envelope protein HEMO-like [Hemicordylus capensis]|uniref:endogenous retroviral envelope protein HEMO-like n=1 Tax=Hemicordylus capensis TaxID=884348 RepID=UPI002303E4DA|nr:endogenous retroviral envelope protein HEMO-like [Hemicordylus capensis]XP_053131923.1 endogenous retroviral envelope protein HEMO-like [Hemicordylus capensis]